MENMIFGLQAAKKLMHVGPARETTVSKRDFCVKIGLVTVCFSEVYKMAMDNKEGLKDMTDAGVTMDERIDHLQEGIELLQKEFEEVQDNSQSQGMKFQIHDKRIELLDEQHLEVRKDLENYTTMAKEQQKCMMDTLMKYKEEWTHCPNVSVTLKDELKSINQSHKGMQKSLQVGGQYLGGIQDAIGLLFRSLNQVGGLV